ncbi:hypothetical protein L873DRAFT_1230660 [Choiromyces venosus 120613-1]|uniref:BZIP domain-containing protein n=1 Tax=Choiromyces venosus 120613-1 TaxID=1336337 RepID=A0A3N4JDX7_9PEZI|nr:hypothetical protein L873DRAFT_1230660 [Choiromyces venosus 120613-1]
MSRTSVDPSVLSTFDSPLEMPDEDLLFSDNDTVGSLFGGDEHFSSTASNAGSDSTFPTDTNSPREEFTPGCSASPQPEKEPETGGKTEAPAKPVKKRKSWGQELPTPTTNLPPRKRAKTEAEKEQRRIERVLRNRAAAQSSRERKRKEVQALEDEKTQLAQINAEYKAKLAAKEEANKALHQELEDVQQKLKRFEGFMKMAVETASATARPLSPISYFEATESSIKTEENPFLFVDAPEAVSVTTLDPGVLLSEVAYSEDSGDRDSSMAHQSAELMCGLRCLQENPSPEAWWGLLLAWISLVLLLGVNTSTPHSYLELRSQLERVQRTLYQMSIQQPFLLNLSSISNSLRIQLQQQIQTSNQALARLSGAATGLEMRSESAVENAFFDLFGISSTESEGSLLGGNLDDDPEARNTMVERTRSYLTQIKVSTI